MRKLAKLGFGFKGANVTRAGYKRWNRPKVKLSAIQGAGTAVDMAHENVVNTIQTGYDPARQIACNRNGPESDQRKHEYVLNEVSSTLRFQRGSKISRCHVKP